MQMPPKSTDTNLNPQTQEHFLLSFERPASSSEDNTLLTSSDKLTIVLCARGCKTVQLNFTEYVLEPGSIAFLYPNTIWKPIKTSSDFQARYLSMREHSPKERNAFLDLETIFSLSTYIARHPHTSLSANESIVVEGYFRLIQNRYEAHVNYAIIRSLISAFILELNQMFAIRVERKKLKISRKEDILWRFLSLLTQHYKENRSVDFYADKLCISPKHLSSVIKQLSHKTAHEIISDVVIMAAKQLLKTTTLSIQEISEELNFANQSFFGTARKSICRNYRPAITQYQQAAASRQFHLLHRRDIGFEQGQGERKFLPTFERDMEIPLYRKIQRKTHEFHGARF